VAVAVELVAAVVVGVVAVVIVVVVVVSEEAVDDSAPEVPSNLARGWPFPRAPENTNYLTT